MERIDIQGFRAARAWGSRLLLDMDAHTARLHWTDNAYHWHRNTGAELFVVLDGKVRMHWRRADGSEGFDDLVPGAAMIFDDGDEHYAQPLPEARVLVIERKDSD